MSARNMTKAVCGKISRSGFHQFTQPARPPRRVSETGFDVLGGLMVVSLSAGIMALMRFVLAN
jgi:hypothetical protein